MISTEQIKLKENELMAERIRERIVEYEAKLSLYMKEQTNFIQHHTFFMYSAIINELYILLTSYDNALIIEKRKKNDKQSS